jgi:pyrroline-5-carboxylate reductase
MINKKIGIIGCGNMGEALLKRLLKALDKPGSIFVSEKDAARREAMRSKYKVAVSADNADLVKSADVIIIAVKPQDFDDVLQPEISRGITKDKLVISTAAGITIKHIEDMVGRNTAVIRTMPNMAAAVGEAISSVSAGAHATAADVSLASEIFSVIGDVVEVDEDLVDAVTALSGSGPAYFFYLVESLLEAADKLGLKKEIAEKLVLKTMSGSLKLLEVLKEDPAALRRRVTSKGGTTEAAFRVLESKKVKEIVKEAVGEAHKHSKSLSKRQGR